MQGHTNLTEIKQAVELLWRNNVQPKQVVLGFGFYGRSFQLEKGSCSKIGCPFKEAGAPGPCTNGPGTLGYFEIQDIIAQQKPEIVHDQDAAVNYFTFSTNAKKSKRSTTDPLNERENENENDQWVSFDDKKTMKQKVDWANELGLGGTMVWSVDQDDEKFSALEGLVDRQLTDFDDQLKKSQVTDTGHWASQNGQKCKLTDCAKGDDLKCEPGWASPQNGDKIKDNCGGAGDRMVCCPVDSMPSTCQWRGGESGRGCHGQCHTDEVTLFHSRHATVDCLRPGFQAFCCEAPTFRALIDSCRYASCKSHNSDPQADKAPSGCAAGTVKVAQKYDNAQDCRLKREDFLVDLCCPADSAFENCHWVGKGSCDDNECSATDIQVDRDRLGDSVLYCPIVTRGREKSLCCKSSSVLLEYPILEW